MAKVDDIRVKVGWFHSRKCKRLQDRLGNDGVIALMQLWCWVATERSRGVLYEMDFQDIAAEAGWPEDNGDMFVNTLLDLKLIDNGEEWLEIHQWEEHQEWAYETEDRSRKASNNANKRWGSNANSNAHSNPTSNANSESSNAPIPSLPNLTLPIPSLPKEVIPFEEIITDLNKQSGRNFKLKQSAKIEGHIRARWSQGYGLDDFKYVHKVKVADWQDTDMAKHICPETLYGTKFEKYRNQQPVTPKHSVGHTTGKTNYGKSGSF